MVSVRIEGLRKSFPGIVALDGVDLEVREGEYVVILGPTGSGKTTLLRTIAGLLRPDAGHVYFDGVATEGLPPFEKGVAYLPQTYSLFGHLNVGENVAFGPTVQDWKEQRREQVTREMLNLVHLSDRRDAYPRELSGGMQQRTALARALATQARLLLLDEPLRALDARLRIELRRELRTLSKDLGLTAIHVTHDQEEAVSIADRIVVLHRGRVVQAGTPQEVYESPRDPFIANFVGEANFFVGVVERSGEGESSVRLSDGTAMAAQRTALPAGSSVVVAVKTDRCELLEGVAPGANAFPGIVVRSLYMGKRSSLEVRTGRGILKVQLASGRTRVFSEGSEATLRFPPSRGIVFPTPPGGLEKALEVE